MGALRAAQWEYDNRMPPAVSESAAEDAEALWIDDGIAELLARRDYVFQYQGRQVGVTFERFALAIDEHAMGELGGPMISQHVLGRLMLGALLKSSHDAAAAALEIMNVMDPRAALEQMAYGLLAPHAREGVLAKLEAEQS